MVKAFPLSCLFSKRAKYLGDKILHPWEAGNVVDFVEQHEAEELADPGHGLQQIEGVGLMAFGGLDDREFYAAQQLVVTR
jgi:hypothetical protein